MESCALDKDGNLMDASKIAFFHSPSDEHPLSGPGVLEPISPSPAPKARPQRHSNRAKYHQAIAELDSDADEPEELIPPVATSTAQKRKHQNDTDGNTGQAASKPSKRKKKSAPKPKGKFELNKSVAQLFLKSSASESQGGNDVNRHATASGSRNHDVTLPVVTHPFPSTPASTDSTPDTPCIDTQPSTPIATSASLEESLAKSKDTELQVSVSITASDELSELGGIRDILTFCDEIQKPLPDISGEYKCHICM